MCVIFFRVVAAISLCSDTTIVTAMTFSNHGTLFAAASKAGAVALWQLPEVSLWLHMCCATALGADGF